MDDPDSFLASPLELLLEDAQGLGIFQHRSFHPHGEQQLLRCRGLTARIFFGEAERRRLAAELGIW